MIGSVHDRCPDPAPGALTSIRHRPIGRERGSGTGHRAPASSGGRREGEGVLDYATATASERRDLTDARQNARVLELADQLLGDPKVDILEADAALTTDPEFVADASPVFLEALRCAASRRRLAAVDHRVHLSVVFAMYNEAARIQPRSVDPHGEDFVREKVRQLDWLCRDIDVTWDLVGVDDGCPMTPSSADVMADIIAAEGFANVRVARLADVIGSSELSPAFGAMASPAESRKGGSILWGMWSASAHKARPAGTEHVVLYTDADLSANLAQAGVLLTGVLDGAGAALGQRYGLAGSVLVKELGPCTEPDSTGRKADKWIVLFRHFVRTMLIPSLNDVLDTQAGFKAFPAPLLQAVLPRMASFNETFDIELLIQVARVAGPDAIAVEPIVFTEDFGQTNFPSVDPGPRHLAMVKQIVDIYESHVAAHEPAEGQAAELLDFCRDLDIDAYVRVIDGLELRESSSRRERLFDSRWELDVLRALAAG